MTQDVSPAGGGSCVRPPPKVPPILAGSVCDECGVVEEADHRIANQLALLAGYLRLKTADLNIRPEEAESRSVLLLLQSVGAQIDAVARVHRRLSVKGQRPGVDLAEHLHEICRPFLSGCFGTVELIEDFRAGCDVRPDQVLPLTEIFAEVLTNAVKHMHRQEGALILARCQRSAAGAVLLEVVDNGPGFPEMFDPHVGGGLGFRLLRGLTRKLGASVTFESTRQGLRFELAMPPAPR